MIIRQYKKINDKREIADNKNVFIISPDIRISKINCKTTMLLASNR